MAINSHTSDEVYRKMASNSERKLPKSTIERVISLQSEYCEQGDSIDYMDFLGTNEEVLKRCSDAEKHLLQIIRRKKYESTIK